MSDILSMNMKEQRKDPQLIVTIISRYRCKRCKQEFTKVINRVANPYSESNKRTTCYNVTEILKDISNNRDTQLHFCNHTANDGRFDRQSDVTDYIKYKVENGESIEVGPAEYLGSNIIKDKRSIDIEEKSSYSNKTTGFIFDPTKNIGEGE
jgi:hypothetical protein